MELVLLPGLDGTGELFKPFIDVYEPKIRIIQLPQNIEQSYRSLAQKIHCQLPKKPYVLLGESFSGGLISDLLQLENTHVRGVIFVASFVSSPQPHLLSLLPFLPFNLLTKLPFANFIQHNLLYSHIKDHELKKLINRIINSIPPAILKNRLSIIKNMEKPTQTCNLPTCYIQASHDNVVKERSAIEVKFHFPNTQIHKVKGSHLILQSNPSESSQIITQFIRSL